MNAMIHTKSGKKFLVEKLKEIITIDFRSNVSTIKSNELNKFFLQEKNDSFCQFVGKQSFAIYANEIECVLFYD